MVPYNFHHHHVAEKLVASKNKQWNYFFRFRFLKILSQNMQIDLSIATIIE
jgi:hypothetical protein